MRILLDTNILIHREARTAVRNDIGTLFRWIDQLKHDKVVHPDSIAEIQQHADPNVQRTFQIKLDSYNVLKTRAPENDAIRALRNGDVTQNDSVDTSLLAEVAAGRVDLFITEDRGIHRKSVALGVQNKVYTIAGFLEKVTAENPGLADYKVLSVRKSFFGDIDVRDEFFDSFREDYPGFDQWFNRKADETAYVCTADDGAIIAFLYVKPEGPNEPYADIAPPLRPGNRLKIGTLKVVANGFKIGERFLKIVFDNARRHNVSEIYVTVFSRTAEQELLVKMLEDWGFVRYGTKGTTSEQVYMRDFRTAVDMDDPRRTYPYYSASARKYIVPIYPEYHTELLPDSILRTESRNDFVEQKPNRNAISKVYISRSIERRLNPGDVVVFYRTGSGTAPAHYTSVATTIGIVQHVTNPIQSLDEFIAVCRKRSVFTDEELATYWNFNPRYRPFVVGFLYVESFATRPNLAELKAAGIITTAPRGFEPLSDAAFNKLLEIAGADQSLIVH